MAQARRSRQLKRVEWGDDVYSSTDIQEIIAATNVPIDRDRVEELSAALNYQAMYYLVFGTGRRKHVTETQFRKDLAQLRSKAARSARARDRADRGREHRRLFCHPASD